MVDRAGEKWIDELESIFSMMTYTTKQRVRLATFKLKDAAKQWWESVKPIDGSELTWEQFKKRFFAYYFSPTSNADEEWKCEQFLDKIRLEYSRQLAAHDIDSFKVMCNKFRAVARRSQMNDGNRRDGQGRYSSFMGPTWGMSKKSTYSSGFSKGYSGGGESSKKNFSKGLQYKGSQSKSFHSKSFRGRSQASRQDSTPSIMGPLVVRSHCDKCGRFHVGDCWACYKCNKMGHIARNCLKAVTDGRSVVPAHVFAMSKEEAEASLKLIKDCMTRLKMFACEMDVVINVSTPIGASARISRVCFNVNLKCSDRVTIIDLICLPLSSIDVIVGMDWLSANGATLYYNKKTVLLPVDTTTFAVLEKTVYTIMVDTEMPKFLFATEVKKSDQEGCQMFMVFCLMQGDKEQKID
ncbi:uncharacterized protein LOC129315642 [Prosopis cineraria]|uniref:uncharacterized protein LOC129315642 n=1 Tax=Prosopis cineraria TaxID=364024 RepID=UPI00240EC233|nr:uncharacterized protein LOC129315642 [Prosopis cineraria]